MDGNRQCCSRPGSSTLRRPRPGLPHFHQRAGYAAPLAGHPVVYELDSTATFRTLALMPSTTVRRSAVTGDARLVVVGICCRCAFDHWMARDRDGLCTLHALFMHPAMLQTYLAAIASIWCRERVVLGGTGGLGRSVAALLAPPHLMLAVGELEQPSTTKGALQGRDVITAGRRMMGEARKLGQRLQKANTLSRVRNLPCHGARARFFPRLIGNSRGRLAS